ncbi:MAG: hypothetical protein J7K51_09225 [Thermotogae bacterium]|nr:hypothetical protein [Thermotogota bacterium]
MIAYFPILFKRSFSIRRISIILTLFIAVPIMKVIYLFYNSDLPIYKIEHFEKILMTNLFIPIIIPISTAIFIVSVVRKEMDTKTISYLFMVPHSRSLIPLTIVLITLILLTPIAVFTSLLAISGREISLDLQNLTRMGIISLATLFAYTSIWTVISLFFKRALIIVMIYIFVWEGTLSNLAGGIRKISVSFYATKIFTGFASGHAGQEAFILFVIGTVAILLAIFKISRTEV